VRVLTLSIPEEWSRTSTAVWKVEIDSCLSLANAKILKTHTRGHAA